MPGAGLTRCLDAVTGVGGSGNAEWPIAVSSHRLTSVWPRGIVSAPLAGGPKGRPSDKKAVDCTDQRRPRSGYGQLHAVVSAMRYVIVIAAIAFFLIWDGLYNQGHYLDVTVKEMSRIVRTVTG